MQNLHLKKDSRTPCFPPNSFSLEQKVELRSARVTITTSLAVPYSRQPTSADHHRQGTPCYQDEALLLIPQIPLLCGTVKKYKAAMLVPGKEARGQDGLQRLRNSVVPAPEKNIFPPPLKTGLSSKQAATAEVSGELWHTLSVQEDR